MEHNQFIHPPPPPPIPVLPYEIATQPPFWLARLICGMAILYGAVSAGYIAASRIPGAMAGQQAWTDIPVAACGFVQLVFGVLGILRVSGSRLGIAISAVILLLCSWMGQWVNVRLYGPLDVSSIAMALVGMVDNAIIPVFLVICLNREPVKGCLSSQYTWRGSL